MFEGASDDIWFTSDLHFGHKGILRYTDRHRKWATADEMDEALIRNLNSVIRPGNVVYHLGDFSFHRPERTIAIKKRLMGEWHQFTGNHDERMPASVRNLFAWEGRYKRITVQGQKLVLFHYPMMSWHGMHKGAWHLHGHCHGNLREKCHKCQAPIVACRQDVGIDCHPSGNYMPFNMADLATIMFHKGDPTVVDHHR